MLKEMLTGFMTTFVLFGMAQCGSCGESPSDQAPAPLSDTLSVYGVWPQDIDRSLIELESDLSPIFIKITVHDSIAEQIQRNDSLVVIFDESGRWEFLKHLPQE